MSYKLFRLFFVLVLLVGSAAYAKPQLVRAAGPWYVATTGSDANDCLSPATPCATIKGAIGKASSGDTVYVAEGTYTGTGSAVVLIDKNITLSGGWDAGFIVQVTLSTIDGQGTRRGVTASGGVLASVERFSIQNGFLFNSGGGVFNNGTLTLNNSIVSGNSTDFGGGIYNLGTLTLNNSTVIGNSATTFGGGILNNGTLTLNNSTVSGNSGAVGGIANSGGTLTVNNSTVNGNSSTGRGGGILNAGGPTGTVTLNNTTVSGNSAIDSGGGIANFSGTGTITLNYSTVTDNISDSDNDGSGEGGGIFIFNSNGSVNLLSSIVAGNKWGSSGVNDVTADCFSFGVLISQGYNLTGSGTGCDPLGGTGDVTVAPANVFTDVLGLLDDNGGPNLSHALIDSLSNRALNAIASGTNSCGSTPFDLDQRGVARPQGSACDIGAFELEAVNPVMEVAIDIKPGNARNRIEIEPGDDEKVSVAILSTDQFSAPHDVDRTSLTFGATGDENSLVLKGRKKQPDCQVRDVNKDRLLDLVCKFTISKTGFQPGDTRGILKGLTVEGSPFEGSDSVEIKMED